jgi:hypothetical protein
MMRYFFHHQNGTELLEDEEGTELPDLGVARDYALDDLRSLVVEAIRQGSKLRLEALIIAAGCERLLMVPVVAALPQWLVEVVRPPRQKMPMDRFGEYRWQAAECCRMARNARSPEDKQAWLKLADAWLQMLPQSEQQADQGLT